jgi:hypothetical protein
MRTTLLRAAGAVVLAGALLAAGGCVRVELPDRGYTIDTDAVDAGDAERVTATIEMGAGKLSVSGGATGVMDGQYEYSSAQMRPDVAYEVEEGEGTLHVLTPSPSGLLIGTDTRYVWDIKLADGLPMDLSVTMGAGESDLDLRGVDLRQLQVTLGAGDSTIDLSGTPTHDLVADIKAGAGTVTLRVPSEVGVRIVGYRDGLGTYSADGFIQDGDALKNPAYDDATVRYDITLVRGLGDVTIDMVD